MTKGYKIKVDRYDHTYMKEKTLTKDGRLVFDIDDITGEPKSEKKTVMVPVKVHLPLMICNPAIGGDGKNAQPDKNFDLYEIGVVAKKIELSKGEYVVLDTQEYEILKTRVEFISKHLSFKYFEMIRRVMEAEKIELQEKVLKK